MEERQAGGPQYSPVPGDMLAAGGTSAGETVFLGRAQVPSFAWLAVVGGKKRGELHRLGTSTTIGSASANHVVLDDPDVGAQHALVSMEIVASGEKRFALRDLSSLLGTMVNEAPVSQQVLRDGDRIGIGQNALVFRQI